MLLTKEIEVVVTPPTCQHYIDKGYNVVGTIKNGRFVFKRGQTLLIDTFDLLPSSKEVILYECDNCGKEGQNTWGDFQRYLRNGKSYCNKCSMKLYGTENYRLSRLKTNNNSFEDFCLENGFENILNRWDYDKNDLNPSEVSRTSSRFFWFLCENGFHESEKKNLSNFTMRKMEGFMSCVMCNSLGHVYPQSLDIWSDKNEKTPFDYSRSNGYRAWWRCPEGIHKDYNRKINIAEHCEFRCPKCVEERDESFLQEKVRKYLSERFTVLNEHLCTIRCYNPKTGYLLRYDNEVKELRLLIEVNGKQHYTSDFYRTFSNLTLEEAENSLEYQKWKDQYKREFALNSGYFYLEIPYFLDDEQESYKQVIDDKINDILNNY